MDRLQERARQTKGFLICAVFTSAACPLLDEDRLDAFQIAVVGKGLTFDSGGYNLKAGPGSMIEMMKFDMGGSGATLGAALATAGLAPAGVEVHFIVASCENMIDGKGLRPGDVITASNGKTVEVCSPSLPCVANKFTAPPEPQQRPSARLTKRGQGQRSERDVLLAAS